MTVKAKRGYAYFLFVFFFAPSLAYAQSFCSKFDGNWSGSMSGRIAGPVSMKIKDCSVEWNLPDGRKNYCDYSEKEKRIEYKCSLGSHGIVNFTNKKITMRNVFTGNDYVVNIQKQ